MDHTSDWYFTIVFCSSIIGFVVSGILFFKNDSFPSRLLASFLVCISLLCLNYGLMVTAFFQRFPHLWRIVGWASFCFAPLCYLYVRSVLEQSYRLKKWDFLLFIPAILHPVHMIPFFIKSTNEKIAYLKIVFADQKLIYSEHEGLFPPNYMLYLRIIVGIASITAQCILLFSWKERIFDNGHSEKQNQDTYKWLAYLTAIMGTFWMAITLKFVFNLFTQGSLNTAFIFTITGTILFVSISLLARPSILYGLTGWLQDETVPSPENKATAAEHIKKNTLTLEQGLAYKVLLENHFQSNLPFLKQGYTISELSGQLGIASHQISGFINQEYGKNFNEIVNEYRVDYLEDLVKNNPEHHQYTLEALGKIGGFNSRASFITAVKKRTGKTPSEFFKRKQASVG